MKYLITGTNGYIGKILSMHLISKGHEVLEIKGRNDFEDGIKNLDHHLPDVVIHAGCTTEFVPIYLDDEQRPNLLNTKKLISRLNQMHPRPYFMLISAAGIYGISQNGIERDETSGPSEIWFQSYDETQYIFDKKAQHKALLDYLGPSCALCLTTVFGSSMSPKTLEFYKNISKKSLALAPSGGTSFLGEEDLFLALDECVAQVVTGTFILSSGNITFRKLFATAGRSKTRRHLFLVISLPSFLIYPLYLAERWLKKMPILISTFGYKYYSCSKLYNVISWRPQVKIKDVFRNLI